jgi:hypothetical protein
MNRSRLSAALNVVAIFCLSHWAMPEASAQARYDDHEIDDRIFIALGAFDMPNFQSKLRVDPKGFGIGTVIDLEDNLNVENSISVVRLDGYFRFNRAHRFEWTYFDQNRTGSATLVDEDIQIGDTIFPVNFRIDSEWDFEVLKASYAYSFVNTAKYEFYLGAGLNIRDVSVGFRGEGTLLGASDVRIFEDGGTLPLPTFTAGMQYNLTDKLNIRFRAESFFIQVNDASGRWQDSYLIADYRIGDQFGIGGGLNFFNISLEADLDDDHTAEMESNYTGLLFYVSARF